MTKHKVFRGSDEVNWGRIRYEAGVTQKEYRRQNISHFTVRKWQVSQFGLNYVVHISLEFAHKALKCGENSGTFRS